MPARSHRCPPRAAWPLLALGAVWAATADPMAGTGAAGGTGAPPAVGARPRSGPRLQVTGPASATASAPFLPALVDQRYGEHPRQTLDVFQPTVTSTPAPVFICLHGGGFASGDKVRVRDLVLLRRCVQAGIAVVTPNYRFVRGTPQEPGAPYPAPMLDAARALQFVRANAAAWNLDAERIALGGVSTGGCMALWVGLHADLADAAAADPVARQSTRVRAVVALAPQTVLDPAVIAEHIGGNPAVHPVLPELFGVKTCDDLLQPDVAKRVRDASPLYAVSRDDPPLFLRYHGRLDTAPLSAFAPVSASFHHAAFGRLLKERYDAQRLTCLFLYGGGPSGGDELSFLLEALGRAQVADPVPAPPAPPTAQPAAVDE